jgi:hypothetical protein
VHGWQICACGKISLACGISCCLLPNRHLCIVKNMCVCMYTRAHISDCVQVVYELQLLPNYSVSETFLHKLGAGRSVDWIFVTGALAWQ